LGGAVAVVALLALLGAGWGCGGGRPSPPPQPPPVVPPVPPEPPRPAVFTGLPWRPDPAFDGQLGFYQAVEGYEIRVPNGFEEAKIPLPPLPGGKAVVWGGPTRDDGSRPMLAVIVITPPPGERTDYGLSYIIEKVRPTAEQCSDWKQSAVESGGLGSWGAVRTGCRGTMSVPTGKVPSVWSVYLCQTEARTFVLLFTVDRESELGESLRITNAAIMTLRKQGGGAQAAASNAGPPDDLPDWQPSQALADELGPPQEIEDYRVRVPKGFERMKDPPGAPPETRVFAFAGPRRGDNSRPTLVLALMKLRPEVAAATLDNALETVLAGDPKSGPVFTPKKIEWGKLGDLTVVRSRLDVMPGQASSDGKTQAFLYVCRDSGSLISIRASDIEPHNRQSLRLCNAAALTFQRK
jgi:hypothetical protein